MISLKKQFVIFVFIALVLGTVLTASANGDQDSVQSSVQTGFADVKFGDYAYDAITLMAERKIIAGYPDNTFKPNNLVTRAEYATMMVSALNLPVKKAESSTFKDVAKKDWEFKFVESARDFLTWFKEANNTLYFRPDGYVEREDMAVALVKALGYKYETADESVLTGFTDQSAISSNLRRYVAIAVKHNVMEGIKGQDNSLTFAPRKSLTRAETALLLSKLVTDEKTTGDEEKETAEVDTPKHQETVQPQSTPPEYTVPRMTARVDGNRVIIGWQAIKNDNFQGYKVIISKNDSTPQYPENGYLYYITNKNQTSAIVDNHEPYKNGDFGEYLTPGQKYYFSVTALYNDRKVPGNVVALTYPGSTSGDTRVDRTTTTVTGKIDGSKIVLNWQPVTGDGFNYYKVVISKNNSRPKYPEDGYLYYFTDKNQTTATIDNSSAYNGGDFGGYLVPGEKYYFSITVVYGDRKLPSNTISLVYPG